MDALKQGSQRPDENRRRVTCQFDDNEKDRQQVDEPQRAKGLDEGLKIEISDMGPALLGGKAWGLEAELDRHPQHVKIGEVHDLAIKIGAPVTIDDESQKKPGNQEEVRHPEWLGEGHG